MTRRTLLSTAAKPVKLAVLGLILCMTSPGHAIDYDRNTVHPMTILTLSRSGGWGVATDYSVSQRSQMRSMLARQCRTCQRLRCQVHQHFRGLEHGCALRRRNDHNRRGSPGRCGARSGQARKRTQSGLSAQHAAVRARGDDRPSWKGHCAARSGPQPAPIGPGVDRVRLEAWALGRSSILGGRLLAHSGHADHRTR